MLKWLFITLSVLSAAMVALTSVAFLAAVANSSPDKWIILSIYVFSIGATVTFWASHHNPQSFFGSPTSTSQPQQPSFLFTVLALPAALISGRAYRYFFGKPSAAWDYVGEFAVTVLAVYALFSVITFVKKRYEL